jgi:hypothetical protein
MLEEDTQVLASPLHGGGGLAPVTAREGESRPGFSRSRLVDVKRVSEMVCERWRISIWWRSTCDDDDVEDDGRRSSE